MVGTSALIFIGCAITIAICSKFFLDYFVSVIIIAFASTAILIFGVLSIAEPIPSTKVETHATLYQTPNQIIAVTDSGDYTFTELKDRSILTAKKFYCVHYKNSWNINFNHKTLIWE